jgi:hypothetical protein
MFEAFLSALEAGTSLHDVQWPKRKADKPTVIILE